MRRWRVPYPKFGAGAGLTRIKTVAAQLNLDLAHFGAHGVAIVGSNGKGSTAAMAAALLRQARQPVGLFTSPHMLAINERFRIDDEDICDEEFEFHWNRVVAATEAAGEQSRLGGFAFLFLIAADWFAARGCAHSVWEAGIGGRLDPVRLIEARHVALTSLDLEHTELLGDTLEAIAADKIEAAPAGATLHFGQACMAQRAAIEAHCARRTVTANLVTNGMAAFSLPLAGAHQRANAALALALARGCVTLTDAEVRQGFAATRWPGRLETLRDEPLLVIDVGHTPDAARAAAASFNAMSEGRAGTLVCGVSETKKLEAIVHALTPGFSRVICTSAHHSGAPTSQIAGHAASANPQAEILLAEDILDAHRLALLGASPTLVAGGLFLAAEFKAAHLGRDPKSLDFF